MSINSEEISPSFQSQNSNPESSADTEFNSIQSKEENSQLTMKPILVLKLSMLVLAIATTASPTTTTARTKRGLFGSVKAFFSQLNSELSEPPPRKSLICIWKICSRKVIRPKATTSATDLKNMEILSTLQRLYPDQDLPNFKIFDEYVVHA